LPEKESFRKMIAYAQKERWIWIHPQYKNGQDDKKKKQKRQETSKA
jgi:lauroyl/myristoyl acyltransferase